MKSFYKIAEGKSCSCLRKFAPFKYFPKVMETIITVPLSSDFIIYPVFVDRRNGHRIQIALYNRIWYSFSGTVKQIGIIITEKLISL